MLGSSMILIVGACSVGVKHPRCNAPAFSFARSLLLLAFLLLQMIVDCRPANRRFNEPPSTVLASPKSLSRVELGECDTLNSSTIYDVRSCFDHIRISQHVAEYVAIPPLDASLVDSCKGNLGGLVWPCVAALPIGFSWSLWFALDINRAQVQSAGMPAESELNMHTAWTVTLRDTRSVL